MPYIGRNHIAGDHTSNFKVLDDISSYTATFDGSATSIVSAADETIRIPEHRFIQGQRVTYTNGGGGNIGGLTSGTAYYVSFDSANTIKLASTLANANSNTVINLSSVGSGTSHTLNAAFDGINTQFKATHNSGDVVNINNSTQLQIAINNVLQKPNIDSSYTEGFLVVDSRKIQFKTAPTADDIFWGSIIANTIETFDISDLKIDNFTGDGSTTQYTLSRDVPNNQSIMVTLDGVTQHASDNSTARSYSLVTDTIIQFTAAPGNGVEIQVRHLGFAGASTGDVSGFYGRTGNVTLSSSDHITTGDITSRNINASGIVTASSFSGGFSGNIVGTSATFTGNLSVGGVLTYEDVTNVDSVGIITAQKDIHVGAGVSVVGIVTASTFKGDGDFVDIDVDGHTNLDNVSIAGVTTFTNGAGVGDFKPIQLEKSATTGATRIQFLENGTNKGGITYSHDNNRIEIQTESNGKFRFNDVTNAQFALLDGTGLTVNGASGITALAADINGDLDVDGHTNLDNVSIAGMTTAHQLKLIDNRYLQIGSDNDIQLYHDTNNSYINASGSAGSLFITGPSAGIKLQSDGNRLLDAAGNVIIKTDATTAYLYHEGSNRLNTTSVGINIPQDLDVDGHTNLDNVSVAGVTTFTGRIDASDNIAITSGNRLYFGNSDVAFIKGEHGGSAYLAFGANNEKMRLTRTGRLGIGTDNPGAALDVRDASGSDPTFFIGHSNADVIGEAIRIGRVAPYNTIRYHSIKAEHSGNANSNMLAFHLHNGSTATSQTEVMRLRGNGHVGIATEVPAYRLDIGDGANDPASGYQFRINASGDYIFALQKQSTPSFSIRNNATSVVHLNTQNNKRLALGVSSGNASGSIEEHVNINSSGSLIVGSSSYGAAGSFSVGATGTFRQILASGTAQDTLIGAISGVSNGFQITTDANNAVSYKFHNGSANTNIINTSGHFGTGTNNPVAQFVVSKQNGEGVEFVPGSRTDENDIYHYDRGSNAYCSYRTYATKHEFWRAGTTQAVEVTPAGNLKVYGGSGLRMATSVESHTDYFNVEADNHGNTLFGLNLTLNYSGSSGTHQVKQVNAHGTIGSAGMYIGGNGSNNNSSICFFRNGQGNSAGQVFSQDSYKFKIGSEMETNNNVLHRMKGFFRTNTSGQNASNGPQLAIGQGYGYGYQEAYSTTNGNWVHPYPDLVLGYHTGVSLGGYPNYGGCRFFGDHPSSSTNTILSVGNGGSGVHVTNTFTAGANKGFRIAHPHPSKKYTHDLVHNAIEAPQMDLIYRGKIDLVAGSATVNIDTKANMTDGTFVLLNRDVQCFTSNETGWTAVKGSVSGNILTITAQDNSCTDTISWMVVGERQDDKIKGSELTTADGDLITEPLTIEETHLGD